MRLRECGTSALLATTEGEASVCCTTEPSKLATAQIVTYAKAFSAHPMQLAAQGPTWPAAQGAASCT